MTEMKKPKKFGVAVCQERECPELRRNESYPEGGPQRCMICRSLPGNLSCCIQDPAMPPSEFLDRIVSELRLESEKKWNRKVPGPRNCPTTCPYKISVVGEVFGKTGAGRYQKKQGTIWKCAFSGGILGQGIGRDCHCHVLDNPDQDHQIGVLQRILKDRTRFTDKPLQCGGEMCPDGVKRCGIGETACPVIKLPLADLQVCPLWRIPAKLLPECDPKEQGIPSSRTEKVTQKKKTAPSPTGQKLPTGQDPVAPSPTGQKLMRKKKSPAPQRLSEYRCATCPRGLNDTGGCPEYLSFPVDVRPIVFGAIEIFGCCRHPKLLRTLQKIHAKNPHRKAIQEAGNRQKDLSEFGTRPDRGTGQDKFRLARDFLNSNALLLLALPMKSEFMQKLPQVDALYNQALLRRKMRRPVLFIHFIDAAVEQKGGKGRIWFRVDREGTITRVDKPEGQPYLQEFGKNWKFFRHWHVCPMLHCGICGHHKGRKTFYESCPRLNELMFKGGPKSAKILMQETSQQGCRYAIPMTEQEVPAK